MKAPPAEEREGNLWEQAVRSSTNAMGMLSVRLLGTSGSQR